MLSIPVSAVVPTRDRRDALSRTLSSLAGQCLIPRELIVVDASRDSSTKDLLVEFARIVGDSCGVRWVAAQTAGAAVQRNQGTALATEKVVWYFDDDILFEPDCVARLWRTLDSDDRLGGVNAMITNQQYRAPGRLSRLMFRMMSGRSLPSYAGLVLGPAWNLLPEDSESCPEVVPVEWLNLGCTLYRRAALPNPPFSGPFAGYSLMEDLALSLTVGKNWKLANVRTARIFHDSQPGAHKSDLGEIAEMELINRHYIMSTILGRRRAVDYLKLIALEVFSLASAARRWPPGAVLWPELRGKMRALVRMFQSRGSGNR